MSGIFIHERLLMARKARKFDSGLVLMDKFSIFFITICLPTHAFLEEEKAIHENPIGCLQYSVLHTYSLAFLSLW